MAKAKPLVLGVSWFVRLLSLICLRGWAFPGRRYCGWKKGTFGAGAYLTALLALGIDQAAPRLPAELWQGDYGQCVKLSLLEKGADDAEYF
jgi:hypothetical protein